MIVFPATSITFAPRGTETSAAGPTAVTRFRSTTTVAFSSTSSPRIVMTRAPTSAIVPDGSYASARNPMCSPSSSGAAFSSTPSPPTHANVSTRSRWKSSGPSDQ